MTEPKWSRVETRDGWNRYDVCLNPTDSDRPKVFVIKERRDTGLEFTQTIKPGSAIWRRAVRLAREQQAEETPA